MRDLADVQESLPDSADSSVDFMCSTLAGLAYRDCETGFISDEDALELMEDIW